VDLSDLPPGRRVAVLRKRAGLTQVGLAAKLHRSVSWVVKMEHGERSLDSIRVLTQVADALGVQLRDLREDFDPLRPGHKMLPDLRWALTTRALGRIDPREPQELSDAVTAAWDRYDGDPRPYSAVAPVVPGLVAELRALTPATTGDARRNVARSLSMAAWLASRIARELGQIDLAWIAADIGLWAAREIEDPVYAAAAASRIARAALRDGRADDALAVVEEFAAPLRGGLADAGPPTVAAYGTLQLVAAVSAARMGDAAEAATALAQARAVADPLGRDRNDLWVAFGPMNTTMHEVAVALEFGDPDTALELSRRVEVSMLSHVERRATHRVQTAHASVMRRRDGHAVRHLDAAVAIAPEALPYDTLARQLVATMLRRKGRKPAGLQTLATRLHVAD
jgi:transcriptional regulator with XRE-family HTH domain